MPLLLADVPAHAGILTDTIGHYYSTQKQIVCVHYIWRATSRASTNSTALRGRKSQSTALPLRAALQGCAERGVHVGANKKVLEVKSPLSKK